MAACLGLVVQFVGQCGEEKSKYPLSPLSHTQQRITVLLWSLLNVETCKFGSQWLGRHSLICENSTSCLPFVLFTFI